MGGRQRPKKAGVGNEPFGRGVEKAMGCRILLIEDDLSICEMVGDHLAKEGFLVAQSHDGLAGLERFRTQGPFDLVLLDIMLPGMNGMEVMGAIRGQSLVPVLLMSAKDTDVDKAIGLGLGADDYIAKPFSLIELTARVKAAIRRAGQYPAAPESRLRVGDLVIDLLGFTVHKKGRQLNLTAKEFEILCLLAKNPKRAFTKAQIYAAVWQEDYLGDENVINVHIRRLREKIEDNPSEPRFIITLWGIGYRLGEMT